MLKLLIILLCTYFVTCQNIKDIAYLSAQKYCPITSFEGLSCPVKYFKENRINEINILGGLGFDTIKQITRLPILKSDSKKELYKESYEYSEFTKVSDFFENIYNNKDARAGMYSQREGADELFKNFYSSNMKGTLAQKRYTVYEINAKYELDEYFKQAIELLPETYDKEAYDMIIEFWGDSYLLNSSYGGVFENRRALRECYNADVSEIEKNVESIINNGDPSKEVRFLEYSLYSSIDIIGGNPEIINTSERISSFKLNPVFIFGTKFPLWQIFPEGSKKENMKLHLENINIKIRNFINESKTRIKTLFLEEAKKEKYTRYSQYYAVYDYSKLPFPKYWLNTCPISRPECNNCKETFNKQRSGYSRACVMNDGYDDAIIHLEEKIMDQLYVLDASIDEDGFYQVKSHVMINGKKEMIEESVKLRSGCMTPGPEIIPELGWKYGRELMHCIKCVPWIDYIQEWGQTQEYLRCSCPKTI